MLSFESFWKVLEQSWLRCFLLLLKVLTLFRMCWGISNRVEKKVAKNKNVAHKILFEMRSWPHSRNACASRKMTFSVHCGKKQHFFKRKHICFVEKQKKRVNSTRCIIWLIRSCWTFSKLLLFKNCFIRLVIAFRNRLICFED